MKLVVNEEMKMENLTKHKRIAIVYHLPPIELKQYKKFTFLNFGNSFMMLAMLNPIRETARVEIPRQISLTEGTAPHQFKDELVGVKRRVPILRWIVITWTKFTRWIQRTPWLKGVRDFVSKVWNWVNENILSVFEDDEVKKNLLIKQLDDFNRLIKIEATDTPSGRAKVKSKYVELPKELQELLKEQILIVLKNDRSDLSSAQINERVEQVFENPLIAFDLDRPSTSKDLMKDHQKIPLMRAIWAAYRKMDQKE